MTANAVGSPVVRPVPESSEPNSVLRERLAQQQFWLFGADIRRPDGNVLLDLGFRRFRAPDSTVGSSCYVGSLGDDKVVVHLWGFGCCLTISEVERIYFSRYRSLASHIPATVALARFHSSPELNALRMPMKDAKLAEHEATLFQWFATYERTVQARVGLAGRAALLDQYGARRAGAAWEIPTQWEQLASESMRQSLARSARDDEATTVSLHAR